MNTVIRNLGNSDANNLSNKIIEDINKYQESILILKSEIENLHSAKKLSLLHLKQYEKDYELILSMYRNLKDSIIEFQPKNNFKEINNNIYNEIFSIKYDSPICCLTINFDGTLLAFPEKQNIILINLIEKKIEKIINYCKELPNPDHLPRTIKFSPDNTFIAISVPHENIKISIIPLISNIIYPNINNNLGEVSCIIFTPNTSHMYCSDFNGIISIFSIPDFKLILNSKKKLDINGNIIPINSISMSYENNILIAAYLDGRISLFNLKNLDLINNFNNNINGFLLDISFSPYGDFFAIASSEKVIQIQSLTNDSSITKILKSHKDKVVSISFSKISSLLLSGSMDQSIIAWDSLNGNKLFEIQLNENTIFKICHHPIENIFACSTGNGCIKVFSYNV